jgi:type II secretory pathway pseudopilin PulG
MTLVEVLVALVLSAMVLGMLLPLLAGLTRPSTNLEVRAELAWARAVAADVRALVSPAKAGVPVLQLVPPGAADPFPQLVVQTFNRAGGWGAGGGGGPPTGPSDVRYRLEPAGGEGGGGLALTRTARGWHDPVASRLVLADGIAGWAVSLDPPPAPPRPGVTPLPVAVRVTLLWPAGPASLVVGVPRVDGAMPASADPDLAPEGTPP